MQLVEYPLGCLHPLWFQSVITGTGVKQRFCPPKMDRHGYRGKPISAPLPQLINIQNREIKHNVWFHMWRAHRINVAWKCPHWCDTRVGSLVALKRNMGTTRMVTSVCNYSRRFLLEAEFRLHGWRILVSWIQWLFTEFKHVLGANKCHKKQRLTT